MLIKKQFNKQNSLGHKKLDANSNATYAENNNEFVFVLTIVEKIKESRLIFPQGSVTFL